MFGIRSMKQYYDMRRKTFVTPPTEEVTEAEFIAASVAAGMSAKEAKFNAYMHKELCAQTMVGSRMLRIKAKENTDGATKSVDKQR